MFASPSCGLLSHLSFSPTPSPHHAPLQCLNTQSLGSRVSTCARMRASFCCACMARSTSDRASVYAPASPSAHCITLLPPHLPCAQFFCLLRALFNMHPRVCSILSPIWSPLTSSLPYAANARDPHPNYFPCRTDVFSRSTRTIYIYLSRTKHPPHDAMSSLRNCPALPCVLHALQFISRLVLLCVMCTSQPVQVLLPYQATSPAQQPTFHMSFHLPRAGALAARWPTCADKFYNAGADPASYPTIGERTRCSSPSTCCGHKRE